MYHTTIITTSTHIITITIISLLRIPCRTLSTRSASNRTRSRLRTYPQIIRRITITTIMPPTHTLDTITTMPHALYPRLANLR